MRSSVRSLADLTRSVAVALGERRGVGEPVQPEIFDHARRGVDRVLGPAPAPAPRASGLDRTEQRVGLVDERDVGLGPRRVFGVAYAAAVEERLLVVVEQAARRGTDERGEPEQVVEQLFAREHRPAPFECLLHLGAGPQPRSDLRFPAFGRRLAARECGRGGRVGRGVAVEDARDVVGAVGARSRGRNREPMLAEGAHERLLVPREQQVDDPPGDERALLVVGAASLAGGLHDAHRVAARQPDPLAVDDHDDLFGERTFAVGDGARDELGHAGVALQPRDVRRVAVRRTQARLQAVQRRQLHVLLAERREHLLDVAEEHRARADEQHAGRGEPASVCVQEVRGAVQRDCGLAGAGAARDDEHAGDVGADGLVLFGLDRRDDVAHAAGAVALERGEQRTFARDLEPGLARRPLVEHLVVERGDLPALLGDEVATAQHAHRGDGGRPVERFGDGARQSTTSGVWVSSSTARRPMYQRDASSRSSRPNTSGASPMSRSASRRCVTSQAMSRSRRAWWVPPWRTSE